MKKILRRIYYGTHETGDDIRYRYVDVEGNLTVARKAPSIKELKWADKLPPIDYPLSTRWRKRK